MLACTHLRERALVDAGGSYLVGEEGPEIFRPSKNGAIVPNHQIKAGSQESRPRQSVSPTMHNKFEITAAMGTDPRAIASDVVDRINNEFREAVGSLFADCGLDLA